MKILALDTSTEACSAALQCGEQIFERFEVAPRQHTTLILSMLETVLAEAQLTLKQLDALAFGCGPGSFTGLRLAASVIQGIALAVNLPVIPVSTLRAIAQGIYRQAGSQEVSCSLDAQRDEVYWGTYRLNSHQIMEAITAEQISPLDQVHSPPQYFLPNAQDILVLAQYDYQHGKAVSAEQALPVYLREKLYG